MRRAAQINLSEEERFQLENTIRARSSQARDVFRAHTILMAADGNENVTIASELNANIKTVALWRKRFEKNGLEGLKECSGRGRKKTYADKTVEKIINTTLYEAPDNATHWSTRSLAEQMEVSHMTVKRIWNAHQIKPHLVKTFKLSKDNRFVEKLRDVVGLYLNPPEHALVLCVDEKSQIQALDRTQPGLPLKKGRCGTMTHDYKRNGTTTLFAALNVLEGTVIGSCMKKHRHQEYLKFLNKIKKEVPQDVDVHLIVDNYATHKHEKIKSWLKWNKRFHVHFIPTSSSWLNMVERFFGELTQKRIRRGVFKSVNDLTETIYDYLGKYNNDPKPFVWTKKADEILESLASLYQTADNAV